MEMEVGEINIRFLGTSFGAPTIGRHQQSILAEMDNGDAYLIDAGAPILDILVNDGYDLTKIRGNYSGHPLTENDIGVT